MNTAISLEKKGLTPAQAIHNELDVKAEIENTVRQGDIVIQGYEISVSEQVKSAVYGARYALPETDSASSLLTEEKISSGHNNADAMLRREYGKTRTDFQSGRAVAETHLLRLPPKEDYLRGLESEKHEALVAAEKHAKCPALDFRLRWLIWCKKNVTGVVDALNERLHRLEELKSHSDTLYQSLLVIRYWQITPQKGLVDHPFVFWVLMILLASFEIAVNLAAFQDLNIGSNNIIATALATFFAFSQSFSAKTFGVAWQKSHKRHFIVYLITTVGCCLFICLLRAGIPQENWLIKTIYITINLFFVGLTILLGYTHAQHSDFFSVLARRQKLSRKLEHIRSQIVQIEQAHQKNCERINLQIENKALELSNAEKEHVEAKIATYENGLAHLDGQEEIARKQLKNIEQTALNQYRLLSHDVRIDIGYKSVTRGKTAIPVLNGQTFSHLALILVAGLGCFGCQSSSHPVPETHIEVLIDQTDSTSGQDPNPMFEWVSTMTFPDTAVTEWGETSVIISTIGDLSTQPSQSIVLPASQPFWRRNEHQFRESKARFNSNLKGAFVEITKLSKGKKESFIHRNFFYRFKELSKQPGGRVLLSWSDLIANDESGNFYTYQKNPKRLWEDRDRLIAKMEDDYPLPDLTGIRIVNVHQSPKEWDELHEVSKRFWEYYWTKRGATVEFKTNVPTLPVTAKAD